MGIKNLKKVLRELYPGDHFQPAETTSAKVYPSGVNVLVVEALPQLHKFRVKSDKFEEEETYRTAYLLQTMITRYKQFLVSDEHCLVIVTADNPKLVPIRKRLEQEKRSDKSKHEPYPEGSILVNDGVAIGGDLKLVEELSVGRAWETRGMIRRLLEMLEDRVKAENETGRLLPDHGFILLDLGFEHGPTLYHDKKTQSWDMVRPPSGEGEMNAIYWCKFFYESFPRARFVLETVDQDVLPVLYYLYKEKNLRMNIAWVHQRNEYIELLQLFKLMSDGGGGGGGKRGVPGFGALQFLIACSFNDTDYTKKANTTHGIGFADVCKAMRTCVITDPTDLKSCFENAIKHVHRFKTPRGPGGKKDSPEVVLEECSWLIEYWRSIGTWKLQEKSLRQKLSEREN